MKPNFNNSLIISMIFSLIASGPVNAGTEIENIIPWLWLYGIPDWLLVTSVLGLCIGLSWLILAAFSQWRKIILVERSYKPAFIATIAGALTGVLIVILIYEPWQSYLYEKISALPPPAAVPDDKLRLEQLTKALLELNKSYQRVVAPKNRQSIINQMVALAHERGMLLSRMLDTNPAQVLKVAIPESTAHLMPGQVQDLLEHPLELEGTLEIIHQDFPDKARIRHYLHSGDQSVELHFVHAPQGQLTGAQVRASGIAIDNEMVLDAITGGSNGGEPNFDVLAPGVAVTTGEQRTLVILADFVDAPISCSTEQVENLMFSSDDMESVNDLYLESSYQQLSLNTKVVGPFTINALRGDECNPSLWADLAEAVASTDRIDMTAYQRRIYVLPESSNCPQIAQGQIGGFPSKAWIFRCGEAAIYAHQVGHNLGLQHASLPASEYGDKSDVMGILEGGMTSINAPHRLGLGWLESQQVRRVTESGSYDLAPLGPSPDQLTEPQVLLLSKPNTDEYYSLSYRLPIERGGNRDEIFRNGLTLHRYPTGNQGGHTYYLNNLEVGETFTDSDNGIMITPLSQEQGRITAQIDFASIPCQLSAPSISLAHYDQSGFSGTSLSYEGSLTNMDRSECSPAIFRLTAGVPVGWSGRINPSSLSLAPGQTESFTFSVTAPTGVMAGVYGLSLAANDTSAQRPDGSARASFAIDLGCTRNTPSLSLSPASQAITAGLSHLYALTIVNNDSGNCGSSTFSLNSSLPDNWSGELIPQSLDLYPGEEVVVKLHTVASDNALPGSYEMKVSASDLAIPGHNGTAQAVTLLIAPAQVEASSGGSTQAITIPSVKRGKSFSLVWDAPSGDGRVTGYNIWRNGKLIGSSATPKYTDMISTVGTYSYYVVAHDAAGNMTAPSNTLTVKIVR